MDENEKKRKKKLIPLNEAMILKTKLLILSINQQTIA